VGELIFLMRVMDGFTFRKYHCDDRFTHRLDNIYEWVNGAYRQVDSAVTHKTEAEQKHDLSVDRVLVAKQFVYFGRNQLAVPPRYQRFVPYRGCIGDGLAVQDFANWVLSKGRGIRGEPHSPAISRPLVHLS
jgi:hypothetical protein